MKPSSGKYYLLTQGDITRLKEVKRMNVEDAYMFIYEKRVETLNHNIQNLPKDDDV